MFYLLIFGLLTILSFVLSIFFATENDDKDRFGLFFGLFFFFVVITTATLAIGCNEKNIIKNYDLIETKELGTVKSVDFENNTVCYESNGVTVTVDVYLTGSETITENSVVVAEHYKKSVKAFWFSGIVCPKNEIINRIK